MYLSSWVRFWRLSSSLIFLINLRDAMRAGLFPADGAATIISQSTPGSCQLVPIWISMPAPHTAAVLASNPCRTKAAGAPAPSLAVLTHSCHFGGRTSRGGSGSGPRSGSSRSRSGSSQVKAAVNDAVGPFS